MGRVYLQLEGNTWKEVGNSDFWIHDWLLDKLKGLEIIQKDGWDGVIIVDGKERSGKSVLGMVMGWYLSRGTLTINNFARGLKDAAHKIASLPDKSILIVDEGSIMFSSKDSTTEATKQLLKIMDVVGQKNMIFIICLPCFFDLAKTIAVRRSLFLCHVYPDDDYKRGQYAYWGEMAKKELYIFGKKNYDSYAFPDPEWEGEYLDFKPPFYQEYLDSVKKDSLKEVLGAAMGGNKPSDVVKAIADREGEILFNLKTKYKLNNITLTDVTGLSDKVIQTRIRAFKVKNGLIKGDVPKNHED